MPRPRLARVPVLRRFGAEARMQELRERRWGHITARELRDELPPGMFDEYFKFSFVRNPWDWQVSIYHYVLQSPENEFHELVRGFRDFAEYLDWRINREGPELLTEFVLSETGEPLVDYIGRYETLAEDFAKVCERIGIASTLPHKNRSAHRDFREYYTPATRALVAEAYREDIEYFGYEFER